MNPKSKLKEIWNKSASVQTPKNVGYVYTAYINRPLGRIMAVFAYKLGLSANFLSLSGFFLTIVGALYLVLYGCKTIWGTVFGVFILLFAFVFDDADGNLAKLNKADKPSGEWLDHTLDNIKEQILCLSIFFIILKTNPNIEKWLMCFLLLPGVFSSSKILSNEMKRHLLLYNAGVVYDRSASRWTRFLLPLDYGFLCMVFLLAPFGLLLPVYV
ncbi:MAG: CDP-alcohol phosphatidyltransferase family protein, partial [Elusimicrobia bacterium]|nr:CDP-alcohol phosphatidyltransferase family protein [Elusimicrobiota bacterium]